MAEEYETNPDLDKFPTKADVRSVATYDASDLQQYAQNTSGWAWNADKGALEMSGPREIPATVVHQYKAENFASPWTDDEGSADMTVNGLTSSSFSGGGDAVSGNGIGDYGIASAPADIGQNETWGIAMTMNYVAEGGFQCFTGFFDGTTSLQLREDKKGVSGNFGFSMIDDNGNELRAYSDNDQSGQTALFVVNKNGNNASDIDIYIGDISNSVSTTTKTDEIFDHTNFTAGTDMGFFARKRQTGADIHAEMDAGFIEFKTSPYTQAQRDELKTFRPEV